ncbi:MAG: phenylacetic acid degradation protein PaaN [Pseudomonadota bacterium]
MSALFDTHRDRLDKAVEATRTRGYWSPFPEMPSGKIYGETAKADGEAAFEAMRGQRFELPAHPGAGDVGSETSPYGLDLSIRYPSAVPGDLVAAANTAGRDWGKASVAARVGVCLEILDRLNKQSFLLANAVMHTTGQAFMMAFQAGGAHAQDRGLEAVAYAYDAMRAVPGDVLWEKPQGKLDPIRLDKTFRVVPRGVALVIGCATFPTWNGYPGLFASLATGNPVIVKPHPGAILPLAITVRIGREVLSEAGFDPNVLLLAADAPGAEITKDLVTHPDVRIVDFTGSSAFGQWVRENAGDADVYTEEAGVNPIAITGTDNFKAMTQNIAFSLSLYSGQMCTAPQNLFVPRDGIETDQGHKSFDEVADGLALALDKLLGDPERAAAICGAVQNQATLDRVGESIALGAVARASGQIEGLESGRTATPLVVKLDSVKDQDTYLEERFGPISFVIATESAEDAIDRAASSARARGAITSAIYAADEALIDRAIDAFADAGVALSINLYGNIHVNQSAAFSDFHVSGANPAGNACLTDQAFVANRFRVVTIRRLAA